jgi:hypothetical protein
MESYNDLIARAARYRELADSLDGYRRVEVLNVARDPEIKARDLRRIEESGAKRGER